jgi:glutamate racemase
MIHFETPLGKTISLHLVITDSGIGGLSICAEVEKNLRQSGRYAGIRITYFNAWPEQGSGYNGLPDVQSRAAVFNRALVRMEQMQPDRILIACNTLSILYGMTEFSRTSTIPVLGIIDAGVDLYFEALRADPLGSILIFGTRTTIESGVHRDRLVHLGIPDNRIAAFACHGLAAAIERDPDGAAVGDLIEKCVSEACRANLPGRQLYAGLSCTHYAYVKDLIRTIIERCSGKKVMILDPNERMVKSIAPSADRELFEPASGAVSVRVISKVELDDNQRRAVAARLEPISDATAHALLFYTHEPGLF